MIAGLRGAIVCDPSDHFEISLQIHQFTTNTTQALASNSHLNQRHIHIFLNFRKQLCPMLMRLEKRYIKRKAFQLGAETLECSEEIKIVTLITQRIYQNFNLLMTHVTQAQLYTMNQIV